jgi:putative ABC transport system permease protein
MTPVIPSEARDLLSRIRSAVALITGRFHHETREQRLAEEIAFHIEMQTERNIAAGMSPAEARRAARVSFGGAETWREASRDEYRSRPLDDLAQDLAYAVRTLASAPAFTLAAVLTLAIGIGGNTAIFSAVDGVMFKPLPFSEPDRVVRLFQNERSKHKEREDVAPGTFADWHARATAFSAIAAVEPFSVILSGSEGEEQISSFNVTRDFFSILDARPAFGRLLQPSDYEPGTGLSLVITWASWQKRFGGDPSIVGKVITAEHKPATIVGVLPRDFTYTSTRTPQEMYAPKILDAQELQLRGNGWYRSVARLKPGVTIEQARADMDRLSRQLAAEFPRTNADQGATVVTLRDGIIGDHAQALLLLLGSVGFVLLIACTNVASLMLARTNRRGREFAIRFALGAGRSRIMRQVLTESFIIALLGGLSGIALAHWGVGVIRGLSPESIPRVDEMRVDLRALGFTLAAVFMTTFLFGVLPALRAAAPGTADELRSTGRVGGSGRQHRVRGALVTSEVALAVMLLVAAGLLVRSFASVVGGDRGYRSDHVLGATLFLWRNNPTWSARREFTQRLVERAGSLPGVVSAGATSTLPLAGAIGLQKGPYDVVGSPTAVGQEPQAHLASVTPGVFKTLSIAPHRGRVFTNADDSASAPVVVVNQTLARASWPNENPIGKRIKVGYYGPPIERAIVGVVADTPQDALDSPVVPTIYLPHSQASTGGVWLIIRTAVEPSSMMRDLKRVITELDPRQPVASMTSLDEIVSTSLKPRRFTLVLFAAFSVAALVLAVIGVYGVISHATTERVREFGLRIALGAQSGDIIRMVMRQGVAAASAGVVIGMLGSAALTRLLANMLFSVRPLDMLTFGSVALLMFATALAATYLPARRATRVDPLISPRAG